MKKAIYILVEIPGIEEPRLYVLPWSRDEAEKLEQAMEEGEETNEKVSEHICKTVEIRSKPFIL